MANVTCYGRAKCLHIGTGVGFWERGGMCVEKPVDADNYPGESGTVYAGVNTTGSRPNLRIFENGVEVYRYDIGNDDYAWVSWSWSDGHYCADMEFAFYNGDTKKWSKKTSVGSPPSANVECIKIGVRNTSIVAGQNPGVQSTWCNNGTKSVSIDVPLIIDGIVVNSPIYLQSKSEMQVFHTTDAMKTAGTHTVEIPPEFNKSGVLPITYEIGLKTVRVIPYAICGDGIGAGHTWFYYPAGVKLKIGDQELVTSNPGSGSMGAIFDLTPGETIDWEVLELPAGYEVTGAEPPLGTMVVPDTDFMVELYFTRADACADVTCDDVCIGVDLYSQKCENGVCVTDALIEANSVECEYVAPVPEPEYEPVCTPLLYGDVNGDGIVDKADADLLFNWVSFPNLRDTTYRLACPENADVDANGIINISDSVLLYNYVNFPNDPIYALGPKKPAPGPKPGPVCTPLLYGDVNGDGIVDKADADLLFNWVSFPNLRDTTYRLACPENADVDANGIINISDSVLLYNYVNFPDDPIYALGPRLPEPICTPLLYGDVNGDGVVDMADVNLLHNWVSFPNLRDTTYKLACPENADVNGDGSITRSDAELLRHHVAFPNDPAYALGPKVPGPAPGPTVCTPLLYGDVNGDGIVDLVDANLLFNWVSFPNLRDTTYKLACPENADVTGDGTISISDAVLLYNYVNFPNDPIYALGPSVPEITCDNGCELLKQFSNGAGKITPANLMDAIAALTAGSITQAEYDFIKEGWSLASINLLCPGCFVPTEPDIPDIPEPDIPEPDIPEPDIPDIPEPDIPDIPEPDIAPPHLCEHGDKRTPLTCLDGSQIHIEICEEDEFGGSAWVPSGEQCPPQPIMRAIELAVPEIVYEGQSVPITVQTFCGAVASSGEPATLQVDDMAIRTKTTTAGTADFRWIARGSGMRKICVVIPINSKCMVPGVICKMITISARVGDNREQIKAEKAKYESDLERLRELRNKIRKRPGAGAIPGRIFVPPSLAGRIVMIGGKPMVVPPNGISVPVVPGDNAVVIVTPEGNIAVEVDVPSGGTVTLPEIPEVTTPVVTTPVVTTPVVTTPGVTTPVVTTPVVTTPGVTTPVVTTPVVTTPGVTTPVVTTPVVTAPVVAAPTLAISPDLAAPTLAISPDLAAPTLAISPDLAAPTTGAAPYLPSPNLVSPGVLPDPVTDARFLECFEEIRPEKAFPLGGIGGFWIHKPYAIVAKARWGKYRSPTTGVAHNGYTGYSVTISKHPSVRLCPETHQYLCWDVKDSVNVRTYGQLDPVEIMGVVNGFRAKYGIPIPPSAPVARLVLPTVVYRKECHGKDLWMDRIEASVGQKDFLIARNFPGCGSLKVCKEGDTRGTGVCPNSLLTPAEVCRENRWVPVTCSCTNGMRRFPHKCADGTVLYEEYCLDNVWLLTGDRCPEAVHNEWIRKELSYYGTMVHCNKAAEGKRGAQALCADGSMVHKIVCQGGKWVLTGERCPEWVGDEWRRKYPSLRI